MGNGYFRWGEGGTSKGEKLEKFDYDTFGLKVGGGGLSAFLLSWLQTRVGVF